MSSIVERLILPGAPPVDALESSDQLRGVQWHEDDDGMMGYFLFGNSVTSLCAFFHGNRSTAFEGIWRWHSGTLATTKGLVMSFEFPYYGRLQQANVAPSGDAIRAVVPRYAAAIRNRRTDVTTTTVVHGRSLGCSVALLVAIELGKDCTAVVLESGFTTPFETRLWRPIAKILSKSFDRTGFDNREAVSMLPSETRLLILHGEGDEVVPREHAVGLAASYANSHPHSPSVSILEGGHNNISERNLKRRLTAFLRTLE